MCSALISRTNETSRPCNYIIIIIITIIIIIIITIITIIFATCGCVELYTSFSIWRSPLRYYTHCINLATPQKLSTLSTGCVTVIAEIIQQKLAVQGFPGHQN